MRILHVTDTYLPTSNGVVRSIQTSQAELARLGVRVDVAAPGTRAMRASPQRQVRHVRGIETRFYPGFHLALEPMSRRMVGDYDVVHVHTPGPLGLSAIWRAAKAEVPVIYTYHTRFDDLVQHEITSPLLRRALLRGISRLEAAIARRCDALIAPTPVISEELEARFPGSDVATVASGVDLTRFRPMARATPQPPTFLTLGRVAREKNVEAVIRAFAIVHERRPDARLVVGGTGPDLARCRALAEELVDAAAIEWLGFVPEEALAATYGMADVFVTASRFETQGLTTLEAMASGSAVALADCAVFRPLVDQGAALAFDADDPRDIARTMLHAFERRTLLGRQGLRLARKNSTRACALRLSRVYEHILGEELVIPA